MAHGWLYDWQTLVAGLCAGVAAVDGSSLASASTSAAGPRNHQLRCRVTISTNSALPITPPKARSSGAGHRTPMLAMKSTASSYLDAGGSRGKKSPRLWRASEAHGRTLFEFV